MNVYTPVRVANGYPLSEAEKSVIAKVQSYANFAASELEECKKACWLGDFTSTAETHLINLVALAADSWEFGNRFGDAFGPVGEAVKSCQDYCKEAYQFCSNKWGEKKVKETITANGFDESDDLFWENVETQLGDRFLCAEQ